MSDPSPVRLIFHWFANGALIAAAAFTNDEIALGLMRFLDLSSTSLALLTFLLITIVIQAAIWWLRVAGRRPFHAAREPRVPDLHLD